MFKAYKIRIYPDKNQKDQIKNTFGCCRFLFNKMLEERKSVYELLKDNKKALLAHEYKTEKEYKQEFIFLKEVDSIALQKARINLQSSYKNFFNKKANFPNFKKAKDKQAFGTANVNNNIRVKDNKIKIPKLGFLRFKDKRKITSGKIKSVTISKNSAGQYFASVLIENNQVIPEKIKINNEIISLDMSAKNFAVSGDKQFANEHFYRNSEQKLKRLHKNLSRKRKSSNNKEKSKLRLARFYLKISNRRKDWLHKISSEIVQDYDLIAIEDLDIKQMQRFSSGLSKTITLDFCWSEFVRMLEYKSEWQGKNLVKIDRFFPSSQLCSECGYQNKGLKLSDRKWTCPECQAEHDRDLNAARNIKKEALRKFNENDTAGTAEIYASEYMVGDSRAVEEAPAFTPE